MTDLAGEEFGTHLARSHVVEQRATAENSPPLFSITTCWPQIFESCSATMSVGPPAANGTMRRTTRLGHSSGCICAHAERPKMSGASAIPADSAIRRRRVSTVAPWLHISYAVRSSNGRRMDQPGDGRDAGLVRDMAGGEDERGRLAH